MADSVALLLRKVNAGAVHPLRHLVLREGRPFEESIFSGDEDLSTLHFAAYDLNGKVCAVVSFFEREHPSLSSPRSYQLRGMASHPELRGRGCAKALLQWSEEELLSKYGCRLIWCNARQRATGFYESQSYVLEADPFEIEGIGLHYRMHKYLKP